jgi:hypothetical protein
MSNVFGREARKACERYRTARNRRHALSKSEVDRCHSQFDRTIRRIGPQRSTRSRSIKGSRSIGPDTFVLTDEMYNLDFK